MDAWFKLGEALERRERRRNGVRERLDRSQRHAHGPAADGNGELRVIEGADWNLEIAGIAELSANTSPGAAPAILFDKIPGFPDGFRVLSAGMSSSKRAALALGFPEPSGPMDLVRSFRDRMREKFELIPPRRVDTGPVLENVDRDEPGARGQDPGEVGASSRAVKQPPSAERDGETRPASMGAAVSRRPRRRAGS